MVNEMPENEYPYPGEKEPDDSWYEHDTRDVQDYGFTRDEP